MKARIKANTAVTRRYLEVDEVGVTFCETDAMGGVQNIGFDQIDCVLLSSASILSIQIGRTICKVPYNEKNTEHQAVVRMLVDGCETSRARPGATQP